MPLSLGILASKRRNVGRLIADVFVRQTEHVVHYVPNVGLRQAQRIGWLHGSSRHGRTINTQHDAHVDVDRLTATTVHTAAKVTRHNVARLQRTQLEVRRDLLAILWIQVERLEPVLGPDVIVILLTIAERRIAMARAQLAMLP